MIDALDQAIYDTIHDYRGRRGQRGATALAPRVGMNPGTLQNKAYHGHESQLSLRESIPIQLQTGDFRILNTYCEELGFVAMPIGDFSGVSDLALLDLYADYHAEIGEAAWAISDSLADGRITRTEVRRVQRELMQATSAGLAFLARMEALAEEDDPDAP